MGVAVDDVADVRVPDVECELAEPFDQVVHADPVLPQLEDEVVLAVLAVLCRLGLDHPVD